MFASAFALAAVTFVARPEIGVQAGHETFELEYTQAGSAPGTSLGVASELTYPMNSAVAGVSAGVDGGTWLLLASFRTNLHDPWGKMIDADFATARNGSASQTVEFSHTESRTEARLWSAELAIGARVAELGQGVRAILFGGFRYDRHDYEIRGASGWQLDQNSNRVPISLSDDVLALRYLTQYGVPFLGVRVDGTLSPGISFAVDARMLSAFSSHDDEHVLRNKSGRATPFGLGFEIGGAPMVRVTSAVYLGLDLRIQYLHSVGAKLSQRYYADDPFLDGDQTQVTIPDTDFSYQLLRARALAFVEARF